jgi:hypothetical protein
MRNRESKRDRNRCVNSIAAAFHDLHAHTGSDLVRRGDDAVPGAHWFARDNHVAEQRKR